MIFDVGVKQAFSTSLLEVPKRQEFVVEVPPCMFAVLRGSVATESKMDGVEGRSQNGGWQGAEPSEAGGF